MNLFIELTHNIALLFTLTFVYGLIVPYANQFHPTTKNILQGVSFGLFGVLAIASAVPVANGFIIDGRSVILGIAGAFTGPIPTTIAAIIVIGYRLLLGGGGALPSIPSIMVTVIISLILFRRRDRFTPSQLIYRLFILGLMSAVQSIFWMILLGGEQSGKLLAVYTFPLLLFTPIGTVLLGTLMAYQKRQIEAEANLRASEERYRVMVNSLNEGIILQSSIGGVRTSNPAAATILGLTIDQLEGRVPIDPKWQTVHPDGSPFLRDDQPSMVTLRTQQPQSNIVMGIYKPDGTLSWIRVDSQPLFLQGNKAPYAALTTFTDITEVRKAQEKLRQERDLLRTLIDSTPDYIFLKDAEGRFILTNTAHAQAAGNIQADKLIGKTAFDVFSPELASQFHADDQKIMQSGKELINAERETVDAQGNRKTVLTTKIPWRDKEGQILGLVGISRDVTERKHLEAQTVALASEQERVQVLQRFIMDMSHDFRTPLSVINSSTYLLRRITDPEKRQEKINNIELQSDRMLKLLDDLLEMGHLDENAIAFQFSKEVINPLIQTIVNNFQSAAVNKQQTLEFIPDPLLPIINIDALKFSRAIINLVQNAITYTPMNGKIILRTGVEANQVVLSITDNGIGIAQTHLPHIFERFYRVDGARASTTGGSGLGLPIAKKIIEAHSGSISAESTLGKGSTFVIRLPLDTYDAEKTA